MRLGGEIGRCLKTAVHSLAIGKLR